MQKVLVSCAILICLMAGTATGRCLFGSTVSTEVQYQQHPDAPIHAISFRTSQTVTGAIEFPSLNALQVEQNEFNLYVVDVAIDFGDTLIDIHFLNTEPSTFAPGHFNGYAFIFDAQQPVDISAARLHPDAQLAGLADSDLTFAGNILFLNVANHSFDRTSRIQIDITTCGGLDLS